MPDTLQHPAFFVTGGTLPLTAASYLDRAADKALLNSLWQGDYCFVLNARQMGKSSLSIRTMQKLSEQGIQTVFIDLQKFGGASVTREQWYLGLLSEIGRTLGLRREFLAYWQQNEAYSLVQRFFGALKEIALEQTSKPIVIFLDEIDATRSLSFGIEEFLGGMRECYNQRVQDPIYGKLTFCLVGSALPADLIRDRTTSPFNIGKRIELKDFTLAEVMPLADGLERENAQQLIRRVFYWTSGHPYLTQSLCAEIAAGPEVERPGDVDRVVAALFFEAKARERNVNLADVANRLLSFPGEEDSPEGFRVQVLDLYQKMLSGKPVVDDEADRRAGLLKLSGVTRSQEGQLKVRNRIYEKVFDRKWIQEQMPDAELRRQKAAYRRGVLRTAAVAMLIVTVMGFLAVTALNNAYLAHLASQEAQLHAHRREIALQKAETLRQQAQHDLYIADMNRAQTAYEAHNTSLTWDLLARHRADPDRGFEWGYWQRLYQPELLVLKGHTEPIMSAAFSPDGQRVVTGYADNTVTGWNAHTGQELWTLKGAGQTVAFSPDGRRLITYSPSGPMQVWDVRKPKVMLTLKGGHTWGGNPSVAFSPNGQWVVANDAKMAIVCDARSGRERMRLKGHTGGIWQVAIAPDGQRIATGSEDGTAKVWDVRTGRHILTLKGHQGQVFAVAFSPDGQKIVTGSADKTAKVWDRQSGKVIRTLRGHDKIIYSVAVSPDGQRIATGSWDMTARMWDVRTGSEILTTRGHTGWVTTVAFSPDGQRLLTGSWDGTARIWETQTKRRRSSSGGLPGQASSPRMGVGF